MTNQQSINDIPTAALQEVRQKHGLAAHTIRVEWTGTVDLPAIAITSIEFEGIVNDAFAQGESMTTKTDGGPGFLWPIILL